MTNYIADILDAALSDREPPEAARLIQTIKAEYDDLQRRSHRAVNGVIVITPEDLREILNRYPFSRAPLENRRPWAWKIFGMPLLETRYAIPGDPKVMPTAPITYARGNWPLEYRLELAQRADRILHGRPRRRTA